MMNINIDKHSRLIEDLKKLPLKELAITHRELYIALKNK